MVERDSSCSSIILLLFFATWVRIKHLYNQIFINILPLSQSLTKLTFDMVQENGVSDRRSETINAQSQPKTLEDALKVVDINLPRLVVLPSNAPAKPKV